MGHYWRDVASDEEIRAHEKAIDDSLKFLKSIAELRAEASESEVVTKMNEVIDKVNTIVEKIKYKV